ncbi:MAG: tripartite tricarboxylate transporter substrate binding protein [Betaproteobacteria bacterium]|nr:tripartite tricarboxylate transporter substrate binding protein [Betaproteobacteria bacterium]
MRCTIINIANAICLWLMISATFAQQVAQTTSYPNRPVRVIVPVPPGGGIDLTARIVMTKLSEALGTPFVLDNRAGAGQTVAADIVAKAQPDGYTLLFAASGHTISPFMYPSVPYDVHKDFAPVTLVSTTPLLLSVNTLVKANTVQELIALAKAKPGELNLALATPGSSSSVASELFKIVTNTQIVSVPYKGGAQALTALMSNEVQLIFLPAPSVIPLAKSGKLKVLGTSGKERASYLPDVQTLAEAGIKDFDVAPWYGLVAPGKTPGGIIDKLYKRVAEVLKLPDTRERFAAAGSDIVGSSPKEFALFIDRELKQNSKLIKAIGMKAD